MAQKRATDKKSATRKTKSAPKKSATRKTKSAPKKSASPIAKSAPKKSATGKIKPILGVTTIKSISNYSSGNVKITNTQYGQVVSAPAGDTVPANVDIPWADFWHQFRERHLVIEVGGTPKYYVFQRSGNVCYCTGLSSGEFSVYKEVPGYSRGDGDRILIIESNETFEIQRTGWLKRPTCE